jgi:hypothetical protein
MIDKSRIRPLLWSPLIATQMAYSEERHNSERWESVRRDISHRLRRVCANMAPAEFLALVDSMVATQLKGELRKNRSFGTR